MTKASSQCNHGSNHAPYNSARVLLVARPRKTRPGPSWQMSGNPIQKQAALFSIDTFNSDLLLVDTGLNSVPLTLQLIDSCNGAQVSGCKVLRSPDKRTDDGRKHVTKSCKRLHPDFMSVHSSQSSLTSLFSSVLSFALHLALSVAVSLCLSLSIPSVRLSLFMSKLSDL